MYGRGRISPNKNKSSAWKTGKLYSTAAAKLPGIRVCVCVYLRYVVPSLPLRVAHPGPAFEAHNFPQFSENPRKAVPQHSLSLGANRFLLHAQTFPTFPGTHFHVCVTFNKAFPSPSAYREVGCFWKHVCTRVSERTNERTNGYVKRSEGHHQHRNQFKQLT